MHRWVMFVVLVLMLGSLAACVESEDDDAGDNGDDSAAATASPTAEPTEAEPTEAPDPTATPEPDPTATTEPAATPTSQPEATATPAPDDGDDDGDGEEHIIDIQDNFFDPEELEIAPGDTVTWVNNGELVHTSTLDSEVAQDPDNAVRPDGADTWDSGDLEPGDDFSVTLEVPGEYIYFCRPHEALGMIGTIIVTEE